MSTNKKAAEVVRRFLETSYDALWEDMMEAIGKDMPKDDEEAFEKASDAGAVAIEVVVGKVKEFLKSVE